MRNLQRPISVSEVHRQDGYVVTQIFYPGGVERFGLRKMIDEARYQPVGRVEQTIEAVLGKLNTQDSPTLN